MFARAVATWRRASRPLPAGVRLGPTAVSVLSPGRALAKMRVRRAGRARRAARDGRRARHGRAPPLRPRQSATSRTGSCTRPRSPPSAPTSSCCRRSPTTSRGDRGRGLAADVLVREGGVSVGPHDLVQRIEAEARRRGGVLARRDEAGEADLGGGRGGTLVFGLPGNPGVFRGRHRAFRQAGAACAPGSTTRCPRRQARACSVRALRRNANTRDEFVRGGT